jgi:hypothetical protein
MHQNRSSLVVLLLHIPKFMTILRIEGMFSRLMQPRLALVL